MSRYREEHRQYEVAKEKHEDALTQWKKDGRVGDRPEAPQEPTPDRFVVSDATMEALAELLDRAPRGLLLARDEIAAWMRGFDQYRGGRGADCQAFLEMHRAGPISVDRKTGNPKTIRVESAALSISGGVQPGTLRRVLTPEYLENGLVSRILLAWPPRKRKKWTNAQIDPDAEARYDALFDGLLRLDFATVLGAKVPVDLGLTPKGQATFQRFFDEINGRVAEATEEIAAALTKLEGYCARLALVIHIVRDEANDPTPLDPGKIDEKSVAAAETLVWWFAREAERVYEVLSETPEQQKRRQLAELIHRRGGRIRARDLRQRRKMTIEEAKAALDDLVQAGFGHWEEIGPGPKGGRPTRDFVLDFNNPLSGGREQGFSYVGSIEQSEDDIEEVVI